MLRVRLLGDLEIELDGRALEPPTSRRARALLGWLALDRRMHSRSRLAARFWPDVLDESARTSLRSALSALRRSLGPDSERYLIAGRDDVGLAGDPEVWTDVAEFERCLEQDRLDDALGLWRGELLAGLDDDWVYERRDELRDRVAELLALLAARAEDGGEVQTAIEYTRRRVALDPLAEEPQRDLMRRLATAGDRAAALRVYERLAGRLRDELRIAPSPATRELADTLRHGGEDAPVEPAAAPAVSVSQPPSAVVTLLFTDLVGSTELLGELGDDEAERLRRVHFGLLRDVAAAHAGQEVKNLGDGLMVAFPSAVTAVGCAVAIQQAVDRHNARHGDDRLKVRVGLNVGEPIRDEGDYFGTPVVVAKRLCDAADGGQIRVSALVRGLVGSRGNFSFRPLGQTVIKGIVEPLETWEVEWEPAEERRISLPAPLRGDESAPLIGRDAELGELRSYWRDASAGTRGVVTLVGEPGIGKTRLAAEFCRAAHAEGTLVLLGRCYEESLVPYQAFVEALRDYVSESPIDELRLQLGRHRSTLAKLLPELEGHGPEDAHAATDSPDRDQFLLFEAVASLLRAVADEHPLILVLDDLHWADAPTTQLLRHVVRATEQTPLLILGTYRETEVDEEHPLAQALAELRRARALHSITLAGLAEEEVVVLIESRVGQSAPEFVARSIADRTEGNPFFVEELLRDASSDDDWSDTLARIALPESVKDVLLRRLRRLDEACRRLLATAAVAGREFTLELVGQVAAVAADEVAESLEDAIAARIVEETSSIGRYSFAHTLIRETIYEQLSRTRRAQLHRVIGEAIEAAGGEIADESASELAYHFTAAADLDRAYRYHAIAAAAAQRVYAVEPALAHYSAALEAGAELGREADRDPGLRSLLLGRGVLRSRTGDLGGAAADLEAGLEAARQSGDRVIEMEVLDELGIIQLRSNPSAAAAFHEAALELARALGDTAAETQALDRLSVISSHQLQFDRALELGQRALELARATGDEVVVGRAMDSIKLAVWQLGDLARLEALTDELEALWRERGDLWYLQWSVLEGAFVPMARAQWDHAAERLDDALAINRRVRDPLAEALMLDATCWLNRSRGAYDDALTAGRRAVARATDVGWEDWAAATLGWTLLDLGAAAPAAEVLAQGLAASGRTGAPNETVRCVGQLAWARLLLGDRGEATALAAHAHELLEHVTAPSGAAFLFGVPAYAGVARVLLATGAPERGEALLVPVRDAASRSGWWEALAMSELVLGLCLQERGEGDRAAAALAHAAELADRHGIPATGWEAHAALARLGHESTRHLAAAEAIVTRIAAEVKDPTLQKTLRKRAEL
jgi:class 3 adenylate cyclase/tetratricopeptide (TPR) repeat protein